MQCLHNGGFFLSMLWIRTGFNADPDKNPASF
jgi:hypothetical protein